MYKKNSTEENKINFLQKKETNCVNIDRFEEYVWWHCEPLSQPIQNHIIFADFFKYSNKN